MLNKDPSKRVTLNEIFEFKIFKKQKVIQRKKKKINIENFGYSKFLIQQTKKQKIMNHIEALENMKYLI